mmetsp:Transcript_15816/g.36878  ORF Transcript_15816/g.36878 Transcript_15816/m.36878 type:complete len:514 (-) Transcript_15816:2352-3893(-)
MRVAEAPDNPTPFCSTPTKTTSSPARGLGRSRQVRRRLRVGAPRFRAVVVADVENDVGGRIIKSFFGVVYLIHGGVVELKPLPIVVAPVRGVVTAAHAAKVVGHSGERVGVHRSRVEYVLGNIELKRELNGRLQLFRPKARSVHAETFEVEREDGRCGPYVHLFEGLFVLLAARAVPRVLLRKLFLHRKQVKARAQLHVGLLFLLRGRVGPTLGVREDFALLLHFTPRHHQLDHAIMRGREEGLLRVLRVRRHLLSHPTPCRLVIPWVLLAVLGRADEFVRQIGVSAHRLHTLLNHRPHFSRGGRALDRQNDGRADLVANYGGGRGGRVPLHLAALVRHLHRHRWHIGRVVAFGRHQRWQRHTLGRLGHLAGNLPHYDRAARMVQHLAPTHGVLFVLSRGAMRWAHSEPHLGHTAQLFHPALRLEQDLARCFVEIAAHRERPLVMPVVLEIENEAYMVALRRYHREAAVTNAGAALIVARPHVACGPRIHALLYDARPGKLCSCRGCGVHRRN